MRSSKSFLLEDSPESSPHGSLRSPESLSPKSSCWRILLALVLVGTVLSPASAQTLVRFGDDAQVSSGQRVEDVVSMGGDVLVDGFASGDIVTMGGDAVIEGEVDGDVVTMGGDVEVSGHVHGDVVSSGGDIQIEPGGRVDGRLIEHGGMSAHISAGSLPHGSWIGRALSGFASRLARFLLLLLLALGLHTLARSRFEVMQVTMVKEPLRAGLMGALLFVGGIVAIVVMAITIIGIPAAFVTGISLALASHLGLAVAAAVIGALLPVEKLRDQDALRVAAGVGALFAASLIPFVGGVITILATIAGLGTLVLTRFGARPLPSETPTGAPAQTPT